MLIRNITPTVQAAVGDRRSFAVQRFGCGSTFPLCRSRRSDQPAAWGGGRLLVSRRDTKRLITTYLKVRGIFTDKQFVFRPSQKVGSPKLRHAEGCYSLRYYHPAESFGLTTKQA